MISDELHEELVDRLEQLWRVTLAVKRCTSELHHESTHVILHVIPKDVVDMAWEALKDIPEPLTKVEQSLKDQMSKQKEQRK